jgi:hypothetical protein
LRYLPDCLVEVLYVLRDRLDLLDAAIKGKKSILDI